MFNFTVRPASLLTAALIAAALALVSLFFFYGSTFSFKGGAPGQWTDTERQTIASLSLTNLKPPADSSNQYTNDEEVVAFGTQLFFDKRLSKDGNVSCATCHKPERFFSDELTLAMGRDIGRRNTPSLHGAAYNQWFFWDGRKDSLWSQALAPLENPAEHDFSRTAITKLILSNHSYFRTYTKLFGQPAKLNSEELPNEAHPNGNIQQIKAWKSFSGQQRQQINQIFANTGKAIAAYVTTLKPLESRFDNYVQNPQNNTQSNAGLNPDELRGLRLFISKKAGCIDCHSGPLLTNQSFHNIGTGGKGDSGRAAAISRIQLDPFNCLGEYSNASEDQCQELRYMQRDRHQLWGNFKTPSLRNVANTPPYFHDGRYETLAEVIDHYTDTKATETHLPAIELTAQDKLDLVAFLKTLSANQ
uniref:Cytochrome c551 peroxidase (EC) n=1 Tax=uncultured Thiotrichaceae bacterium TaxID=298394 RepID=A0A6S6UCR4_9GAMM|nr:MAG: Cytochrome c551 peroxidase (EC [uncultured Thiotrichaceae bacterium]